MATQRLASGDIVLYGYTTLGTDSELRIEADGSLAGMSEAHHSAGTIFGGLFSNDSLPTEIVVRGADGTERDRAVVTPPGEDPGSFTGEGTATTMGPG